MNIKNKMTFGFNFKKTIIIFAYFGLSHCFALGLYAQEQKNSPVSPQQLEGFNLNGYGDDGKKSWDINGAKADINDDKIKVTDVDANFYGNNPANLKAKTGTIDKTSGEVNLNEDVVVTSDRGTTMTTDSLKWKRNEDIVETNDIVHIDDAQGTITGKGLKAQPNLKKAQLNEDVTAVINPTKQTKGQSISITSDGPMRIDQIRMYAVFEENVVATEAATGRRLYADKMEAWFDDKNKRIKKLICSGNVKVVQGDNASYAEQMVYNGDDQTLVMTGRPKLVFESDNFSTAGIFQGVKE